MNLIREILSWTLAVVCLGLLILSFTATGTGFFGSGNGLIWSYVLVFVLASIVFIPIMKRPTSPEMHGESPGARR